MKPLKPINLGETVRAKLPGEKVWSPAECVGFAGPRSYLVKTGDAVYGRNRCDLLSTGKLPITDQFDSPITPQSSRSDAESPGANLPPPDVPESSVPSVPESVPTSVEQGRQETPSPVPSSVPPTNLRRSQRERRPLKRFQDFKLTLNSEFCSVLVYKLGINRAVCLCILFALFSFVSGKV